MPVVTRTLIAKLASPTAHKERKLRRLLETYREALQAAVDADADSMTKVNELVTTYDLPYQAKDALKSYVPRLLTVHNAREVHDAHPLRLVNRAARFDYAEARACGFCWEVPMPGRGTNFWIPLHINPGQQDSWHELLDGEVDAGELRLLTRDGSWFLHITIKRHVAQTEISEEREPTRIGIDVGEAALVTACALVDGSPTRPLICDGAAAKQRRKLLFTTLRRLQRREAADWRIRNLRERCRNGLTDVVEKTSARVLTYAQEFERPVLVLEDLSQIRQRFDGTPSMNRRLHGWGFSHIQRRIEAKARTAELPVQYVSPAYTSQTCHACGHLGSRPHRGTFECANDECWVSEYQADINAAVNIANRADPWGASCQLKPDDDDSSRDGRPATGPRPLPSQRQPGRRYRVGTPLEELGSPPVEEPRQRGGTSRQGSDLPSGD